MLPVSGSATGEENVDARYMDHGAGAAAPVWPNRSMPQIAQVDGSNRIGPGAAALDGPLFVPSALSIWPIAGQHGQRQARAVAGGGVLDRLPDGPSTWPRR
jgi:hypothetical protein